MRIGHISQSYALDTEAMSMQEWRAHIKNAEFTKETA